MKRKADNTAGLRGEHPSLQRRVPRLQRLQVWWRVPLLLVTFCLVGIVPLALTHQMLPTWHADLPPIPALVLSQSPTATPDRSLPHAAWTIATTRVQAHPGAGQVSIASFEAGFPVTVLSYQQSGATDWAHIRWHGPTNSSGGSGWVVDNALVAFESDARPIGDLGALSPALGQAMAHYRDSLSAAIYFPESGQMYRVNQDTPFAMGDGFRSVVLLAWLAKSESLSNPPVAIPLKAQVIAAGDQQVLPQVYSQAGSAPGISTYLTDLGVSSIQPGADWLSAQATATAMVQFYLALEKNPGLNSFDHTLALTQLASAPTSPSTADISAAVNVNATSVLVSGMAHSANGWTLNAAGIVTPHNGPRYIVATAIRGQPSQDAAATVLVVFFHQIATLVAASS